MLRSEAMPIDSITGVLCCGNICYDIPVRPVDAFHWGTTTFVEEITGGIGGNGGNTSYTIARLGCPVRVYGKVGHDWQGDLVWKVLHEAGVDLSGVSRTTTPTNCTICVVNSSGDRLFLHQLGASADVSAEMLDFNDPAAAGYSHFHLANLFTVPKIRECAASLMQAAKNAGKTISLDTGWDAKGRWMLDVRPCLPHVDLLFLNESEAMHLTGFADPTAAAKVLRDAGAKDIVIKLGPAGSCAFIGDEIIRIPKFEVRTVDTTGAGDCFSGAFLAGLFRSLDYEEASRLANAVGALNVSSLGGTTGIRSYEATVEWMKSKTV